MVSAPECTCDVGYRDAQELRGAYIIQCPLCKSAPGLYGAVEFLLHLVPAWALKVPAGLPEFFYHTLSAEGDLKVKARVQEARAALAAARGEQP